MQIKIMNKQLIIIHINPQSLYLKCIWELRVSQFTKRLNTLLPIVSILKHQYNESPSKGVH